MFLRKIFLAVSMRHDRGSGHARATGIAGLVRACGRGVDTAPKKKLDEAYGLMRSVQWRATLVGVCDGLPRRMPWLPRMTEQDSCVVLLEVTHNSRLGYETSAHVA